MNWNDFPEFRSSRLVRGGHAQTIVASLSPIRQRLNATVRHIVETTHGDRLVLHEDRPASAAPKRREVLLVHGLGGSHASPNMVRVANVLIGSGYRVWRFDQRGCGAGIQLARYHSHAGRTEDLQAIVDWIERFLTGSIDEQHGNGEPKLLTIAGYSLGANILLKWLAHRGPGQNPVVDSTIAIAPPVDLSWTARRLNRGLGRWYDSYFGRLLKRHLWERRRARPDIADTGVNPIPGKLVDFDASFTAPLGGFSGVEDYYAQCSSGPDLHRIQTPTLLVYDRDDPVVPDELFSRFRFGPGIRQVMTCGGGHLGYVARRGIDPSRDWLAWRIRDWIDRLGDNP